MPNFLLILCVCGCFYIYLYRVCEIKVTYILFWWHLYSHYGWMKNAMLSFYLSQSTIYAHFSIIWQEYKSLILSYSDLFYCTLYEVSSLNTGYIEMGMVHWFWVIGIFQKHAGSVISIYGIADISVIPQWNIDRKINRSDYIYRFTFFCPPNKKHCLLGNKTYYFNIHFICWIQNKGVWFSKKEVHYYCCLQIEICKIVNWWK
jgi:hypothetical protein